MKLARDNDKINAKVGLFIARLSPTRNRFAHSFRGLTRSCLLRFAHDISLDSRAKYEWPSDTASYRFFTEVHPKLKKQIIENFSLNNDLNTNKNLISAKRLQILEEFFFILMQKGFRLVKRTLKRDYFCWKCHLLKEWIKFEICIMIFCSSCQNVQKLNETSVWNWISRVEIIFRVLFRTIKLVFN